METFGTERLVTMYAKAAQAYFEASQGKSIEDPGVRAAHEALGAIEAELRRRAPAELLKLRRLLKDARPAVRAWAAYVLEDRCPDEVRPVYEGLRKYRNEIGISAHVGLARLDGHDPLAKARTAPTEDA